MRFLIVDDELVSRTKLTVILEQVGDCVAVDNGSDALAEFKKAWDDGIPFDVVCLDVAMPGIDGTEVLYEIRELEKALQVSREKPARVLMITAHADKSTIVTAIQAGCDDYIVKPFDGRRILEKIRKMGFKVK